MVEKTKEGPWMVTMEVMTKERTEIKEKEDRGGRRTWVKEGAQPETEDERTNKPSNEKAHVETKG